MLIRTAIVVFALLLTGCQRAVVDAPNPLPIASEEYDRMYDASIAVLRDHGFRVDQQDYRFGEVVTRPDDAPTAIEFWQADNTTAAQAWQSTLDHLRRTVTVFLEPAEAEGEGDYALRVEVLMERRVQPTRRLTGSSRQNVFSTLDAVPAEWQRRGITAHYWEPVGRDPYLEARLLRTIVAEAMNVR
ncbi:MAG: hypothetical protein WDZ31_13640 [Phycisphaeraceae bacterium]